MISSIIFSKDRPLQLDLCLNSIEKNFKQSQNKVVIHNNSWAYEQASGSLSAEHPSVDFWKQGPSLFKDVYAAIAASTDDYICFFTDDNIFYSNCEIPDMGFWSTDICTLSLRMGRNITERYHEGRLLPQAPNQLATIKGYDLVAWPKTAYHYGHYWSYSLSVDGHVFYKEDIMEMMEELCFLEEKYVAAGKWTKSLTPNELESGLQRFWAMTPNWMVAPPTSVLMNSPNNRVQDTHTENTYGEAYDVQPLDLLDQYILGKRINLELLNFDNIRCPHTELDIMKGLS